MDPFVLSKVPGGLRYRGVGNWETGNSETPLEIQKRRWKFGNDFFGLLFRWKFGNVKMSTLKMSNHAETDYLLH